MSMCMYIARGSLSQLRELADDPETLCGLGVNAGGFAALASGAAERLARMGEMLAQRPDLRQSVDELLGRFGVQRPPASAGPAAPGAAASVGLAALIGALGPRSGSGGASGGAPKGATPARPPIVDLHKSWHMFHFLFTGCAAAGGTAPANLLMEGGEEVGEDLGYGPARLLDPAATAALAGFVGSLTVEELKGRLDGASMSALGIYPGFDAVDAADEYADDIEHYFPQLRDHLAAAAAAREATLVWVS